MSDAARSRAGSCTSASRGASSRCDERGCRDTSPGRWPQRQVVEGDGELHATAERRLGRVVLGRLAERSLDGTLWMGDRLQRVGRIHDPGTEGQLLEAHALTELKQHRRSVAIDLDDCSWARHQILNGRRSNATFTAPSRPALIAYAIASRYSPRPKSGPVSFSRCRSGAASIASSNVRLPFRFGSAPYA